MVIELGFQTHYYESQGKLMTLKATSPNEEEYPLSPTNSTFEREKWLSGECGQKGWRNPPSSCFTRQGARGLNVDSLSAGSTAGTFMSDGG